MISRMMVADRMMEAPICPDRPPVKMSRHGWLEATNSKNDRALQPVSSSCLDMSFSPDGLKKQVGSSAKQSPEE